MCLGSQQLVKLAAVAPWVVVKRKMCCLFYTNTDHKRDGLGPTDSQGDRDDDKVMLPVKMALPVMMLLVAEILHSWAMLCVKATLQVKAKFACEGDVSRDDVAMLPVTAMSPVKTTLHVAEILH